MKITQSQHGLRIVDSTYLIGAFAFLMAIFFAVEFIGNALQGAPLKTCAGILLGLVVAYAGYIVWLNRGKNVGGLA